MSLIRRLRTGLFYLIYLGFATVALLEVIFRILPVSDSLKTQVVNDERPIVHFKKNREVTLQTGANFSHWVQKKSNNFGYLSDVDFHPASEIQSNRVVVIGDSFVEASQVANEDTFHHRLMKIYPLKKFYPIGVSGAPLSQYLAFAQFSEDNFKPSQYIFVIILNDFIQSWLKYENAARLHFFDDNEKLVRQDYSPSFKKIIARESALVRYLVLDLKIRSRMEEWFSRSDQGITQMNSREISNLRPESDVDTENDTRIQYSLRSADLFLAKLARIVGQKPVLLVLDGDREHLYRSKATSRDMFRVENQAFQHLMSESQRYPNMSVLDMHPKFQKHWNNFRQSFDYAYDDHWNELGHQIVAEAIVESGFVR
ncbi:SGNH/GDSL hydrolase family protein [Arenicellales bacterium IMCC55707]